MVALNRVLNPSFLLVSPAVLNNVATPQQAATEQYNVVRYLGGSAPYIERSGHGIATAIPPQCTLEQAHLLSRHGERYPSRGDGVEFERILAKFAAYRHFSGALLFLNDYAYFVTDSAYYEQETSTTNSQGLFAGTEDARRHGALFRARYASLYHGDVLPVFTSNSRRCFHTARNFARGFLGDDSAAAAKLVVVDEAAKMGANSLTPRYGCPAYDGSANRNKVAAYDSSYLEAIAVRFNHDNPGLGLTATDVSSLFLWCAFEINVRGLSPFCSLFSPNEYIRRSYQTDLENYYSSGPGHNLSAVVGTPLVAASLALLKQDSPNKIWLSFTHDTDMEMFLTTLGLMDPVRDLPVDHIAFPNPYAAAEMLPQGARIYTEKYRCGDDSYVRFLVNGAVVPIEECSSGPGFSCRLDHYEAYIVDRIQANDYAEQCLLQDAPASRGKLTFYWDYNTTDYNAPLINQ